jgi:hypothetical protein
LDVIIDPEEIARLKQASSQNFSGLLGKVLHRQEAANQAHDTKRQLDASRKDVRAVVDRLRAITKKKGDVSRKGDMG